MAKQKQKKLTEEQIIKLKRAALRPRAVYDSDVDFGILGLELPAEVGNVNWSA